MLFKLENPVLLSRVVDLISELVTEVRIKVNEFGLSITAMDPANVAMVDFRLPKSSFSEFLEELGIASFKEQSNSWLKGWSRLFG